MPSGCNADSYVQVSETIASSVTTSEIEVCLKGVCHNLAPDDLTLAGLI